MIMTMEGNNKMKFHISAAEKKRNHELNLFCSSVLKISTIVKMPLGCKNYSNFFLIKHCLILKKKP